MSWVQVNCKCINSQSSIVTIPFLPIWSAELSHTLITGYGPTPNGVYGPFSVVRRPFYMIIFLAWSSWFELSLWSANYCRRQLGTPAVGPATGLPWLRTRLILRHWLMETTATWSIKMRLLMIHRDLWCCWSMTQFSGSHWQEWYCYNGRLTIYAFAIHLHSLALQSLDFSGQCSLIITTDSTSPISEVLQLLHDSLLHNSIFCIINHEIINLNLITDMIPALHGFIVP